MKVEAIPIAKVCFSKCKKAVVTVKNKIDKRVFSVLGEITISADLAKMSHDFSA